MSNSKAFIVGVSSCGETICAAAGRISTQPGSCEEILQKSADAHKNINLINKVTASGHNSTVEHIMFNLAFQDVSAVVEQFMIEFRLASFTVKSRRYVDFSTMGYYVPDFCDKELENKYREHMNYLFSEYRYLLENGIKKEDARFILPYCLHSNFFCSLNGREFLHVLRAMLYGRGSKFPEIKALGEQLKAQAVKEAPGVLSDFEARSEKDAHKDEIDLSFLDIKPVKKTGDEPLTELLYYTPDAEKCVAKNALAIYSQANSKQIEEALGDDNTVKKIIDAVVKSTRPRPLESVSFTFRLNNVTMPCITHFVRHRMQAVEIPSLTQADRTFYKTPKAITKKPELQARYNAAYAKNAELYKELQGKNVPEEILVYFLLCGSTLDLTATFNARELMLLLRLRTCTRAQWEIREYAIDMLKKLRAAAPKIFNHYGPGCYLLGACPESEKFTCGREKEMQDFFKA